MAKRLLAKTGTVKAINTDNSNFNAGSYKAVGGTVATAARYPDERRANDEKLTQYQNAKPVRNTKQYHTTTTSPENLDTPCIDDMVRGSPSERSRPVEFEYVADGQQWKKDTSGTVIPEWQLTTENLQDPHATNRTSVSPIQGFHKAPAAHMYSEQENRMISSGGVVDHYTKMPSFPADKNRI